MAMTCSLSKVVRSARARNCSTSDGLTGREEAQISAWPAASALNPVLDPWAATSTSVSRLFTRADRICSFSCPVPFAETAPVVFSLR